MKPHTKDLAEGSVHEMKGAIKEEVGKATNDPKLEVAGKTKKAAKAQKVVGQGEKSVGK